MRGALFKAVVAALPGAQGATAVAWSGSRGTHPAGCRVIAALLQFHTSSNSQWAGDRGLKALCRAGPVEQSSAGDSGRPAVVAAAAAGQADDASLTPCERLPQRQETNELDIQLAHAGREEGAAAVLALIETNGEKLTEKNVVTALTTLADAACGTRTEGGGLGKGELVKSAAFQGLVDIILAGTMRFEPAGLAQAVWSCGQLGASEEMLLDEVGRHLMRHTDQLSAPDIVRLVAGYAALEHSPSMVLFETVAGRAADIGADFLPQQRQQLLSAYERLGYRSLAPSFD